MSVSSNRRELLEKYLAGAGRFDRYLGKEVADELLRFRPDLEDAWSILEHLAHVLDTEVSSYIRFRTAVAEPGAPVMVYDQGKWRSLSGASGQSARQTLEAFKLLRTLNYGLLKGLEDREWSGFTVQHPQRGRIDLEDLLTIYTGHVDFHLEYLRRNEELWEKSR